MVAVAPISVIAFKVMASLARFIMEGHCCWKGDDGMGSWMDA